MSHGSETLLETRMVDISEKQPTARVARARGEIYMQSATLQAVLDKDTPKGDVLTIAQIAGIQGAKQCAQLIPLCHPLLLNGVNIDIQADVERQVLIVEATVKITGKTGVEMEALCAVNAALLTIYDMCKGLDPAMEINGVHLCEKTGGRHGHYLRAAHPEEVMS
jgi:cyclic pyranopterin monophosphate synthase